MKWLRYYYVASTPTKEKDGLVLRRKAERRRGLCMQLQTKINHEEDLYKLLVSSGGRGLVFSAANLSISKKFFHGSGMNK